MANSNCPVVAGVVYLRVDGRQLRARAEIKVSMANFEREAVIGQDGVHGYIERPAVAFIEGKITDSFDLAVEQLQVMCNVTVTVELLNGKVYVLRNAWCTKCTPLDTTDGSIEFRFEGRAAEELLGSGTAPNPFPQAA
jgi:Phage tail tube protein